MKQLSIGVPLTVRETTVIPLERVTFTAGKQLGGYWLSASKEIVAVVICRPDSLCALDMEARELRLDELTQEFPELGAAIRECRPGR